MCYRCKMQFWNTRRYSLLSKPSFDNNSELSLLIWGSSRIMSATEWGEGVSYFLIFSDKGERGVSANF